MTIPSISTHRRVLCVDGCAVEIDRKRKKKDAILCFEGAAKGIAGKQRRRAMAAQGCVDAQYCPENACVDSHIHMLHMRLLEVSCFLKITSKPPARRSPSREKDRSDSL